MSAYQPKTGAKCSCKRGMERDNCPQCEGTGMVIDFATIRAMPLTPKTNRELAKWGWPIITEKGERNKSYN